MDLRWNADGLVAVVAQDRATGEVRMLAHANAAALEATLETGEAHFYSRSRRALWRKGESSGHTMAVREVWADCDRDALLYLVEPRGPTCHTGAETCFTERVGAGEVLGSGTAGPEVGRHARPGLAALWAEVERRRAAASSASYTRSLLDGGPARVAAKVREEAGELARAIEGEDASRVVAEAADLVYHVLVGLLAREVTLADVERELLRRAGVSGHAEKASRT